MTNKPTITIYTDGACSGNPGPGGWGALLLFADDKKEILGYELNSTNNRMEITAAIEALQMLTIPYIVEIYTDSKYLEQGITKWIYNWLNNNWRKSDNKPVKNSDLWKKLYEQLNKHEIIWRWVKAHAGNFGNERADTLALNGKAIAIKKLQCLS
jgi:ribonuclease HI